MCGMVGVLGDVSVEGKRAFLDLMDVCQIRGRDATGVIKVDDKIEYSWIKEVGPPAFLFDKKSFDNLFYGPTTALIGHCRKKTVGENNKRNAHPFDFPEEGICGVHNGTLTATHLLDTHTYQKVDSEILYGHLSKNGPEETFNKTTGAWACVWWDDTQKTVNFIRNNERPLFFAWSEDKKMMFWASEPWFFGAVERHLPLWVENNKKTAELPVDFLWSFKLDEGKKVVFKPPVKIERKKYEPPVVKNPAANNSAWVKDPKTGIITRESHTPDKLKGGEVANPFQREAQGSLEESGTSELCHVNFLKKSAKNQKEGPESKKSGTSERNILSLPSLISRNSHTISKNEQKGSCQDSSTKENISPLVSLREIKKLGTWYIYDNIRKVEYSEEEFESNTGAVCSYCEDYIGSMEEVAYFLDKCRFVCKPCNEEGEE